MATDGQTGRLVVISGPSGVGKSTVCRRLTAADPRIELSVSATTRPPRKGEVHGQDYMFLERREFEELIDAGGLVEWAEYVGHLYGTPRRPLEKAIDAGRVMLLDIDVQGGRQVMEHYPDAVTVFIEPPGGDMKVVCERLSGRGTDSPDQQAKRIERARQEIEYGKAYQHHVENDTLDSTVEQILNIIFDAQETPDPPT